MDENQNPRRRSSFGLLISFLFVISLIVTLVVLLNRNTAKTLTQQEFINAVENNRVVEIYETPKESTIVSVEGSYYANQEAKIKGKKSKFECVLNYDVYYTTKNDYFYNDEENENAEIAIADTTLYEIVNSHKDIKILDVDPYVTTWWDQWGPTIIMLAGSAIVVIFLFSRLSRSVGSSNNAALEFNKSRARREKNSKVRFDDVAGADEEKTEMKELVDYLKDPQKFTKYGAKLPKGVLLVGPPGCGKTLLAKAVAGEAGVPFFSISGSDFVEMFVGVGAGRVRDMFRIAKQNAPCLVFIDEIDAVGRQRGAGLGGGNDEREQTLNQLLVEMDGFNDNSGIIVIAATNRDDVLDPALLRAGRFDRKITVSLPDRKGREEIFKVHSRGKTLLAKAVAGEAGVPFFYISGSDFVEMFVGVGAGRVRDMFRVAKENAPCLVFIDEIDAVGRQRGAGLGGGNDEREQTLNQLLVEMDGFSDNSGIIVIAATNRDDVLDPALLRAGRFDRKITVSLPDKAGREAIFKVHARNKKVESDVDYSALAKRTVGFSGADIENIMNEAAILAVRREKEAIGLDEIDEAIDRRVAGPAKSSRGLSAHEREVVAYHEAGHAIIGLRCPHSDKVQKITIIPRGNTGGHVRMTPEDDRFILTKKELEARIIGYLGGRSSEETFFDDVSTGAQNDIEVATQIARMMVTELGMSSLGPIQYEQNTGSVFLGRDYTNSQKNFSIETATKIDAEVRSIIESAHKEALRIINENKDDLILIAKTLLEHEQITAEEIDYLLANGHLKRDEKPEEKVVEEPAKEEPQPKQEEPLNSEEPKGE